MPDSILVVDDNDMVRNALRDMLSVLGYSVLCASSADEGWALFEEHGARAVITDNAMAGPSTADASGLRLATRIKRRAREIPVIMLSGIPPHGAATVCDVVLQKPAPMQVLIEALRQLRVAPDH